MNHCKLLTAEEIKEFRRRVSAISEEFADTIKDSVIPLEKELNEAEWETPKGWVEEFQKAQFARIPIIEQWSLYNTKDSNSLRIIGVLSATRQTVVTSPIISFSNNILKTKAGSTYRLINPA